MKAEVANSGSVNSSPGLLQGEIAVVDMRVHFEDSEMCLIDHGGRATGPCRVLLED